MQAAYHSQPRKKIPGTVPSIKDALNGIGKAGDEEGKDNGRTIRQVLSNSFTQDDLLEKWNEYAEQIKEAETPHVKQPETSPSLPGRCPAD